MHRQSSRVGGALSKRGAMPMNMVLEILAAFAAVFTILRFALDEW